jgi:hypothetical protein
MSDKIINNSRVQCRLFAVLHLPKAIHWSLVVGKGTHPHRWGLAVQASSALSSMELQTHEDE